MQIALNIDIEQIFNAINILPRDEKVNIADRLESQLLSEWDDFENQKSTLNRVNESITNYNNKEYINLDDL